MDVSADLGEFEGESSAACTAAIGLVGQVIALLGVQIARERSRPRPDLAAIRDWESQRNQAVMDCRRLSSADPEGVEQARRDYTLLLHQVLSAQATRGSRSAVLSS